MPELNEKKKELLSCLKGVQVELTQVLGTAFKILFIRQASDSMKMYGNFLGDGTKGENSPEISSI